MRALPRIVIGAAIFLLLLAFQNCGRFAAVGDSSLSSSSAGTYSAKTLSSGPNGSCFIDDSGHTSCWGVLDNSDNSNNESRLHEVTAWAGAKDVNARGTYPCAVLSNGSVSCHNQALTPDYQTITGVSDIVQFDGLNSYCGVTSSGLVQCWTLGLNPDPWQPASVTTVSGVTNAVRVAFNGEGFCALLKTSQVMCWGQNQTGVMGLGTTEALTHSATLVPGVSNVTKLAGGSIMCALLSNGTVSCWGTSQTISGISSTPQTLPGLQNVIDISVGSDALCAVVANGQAYCAGNNAFAVLGNHTMGGHAATPTLVQNLVNAESISMNMNGACSGTSDHHIFCWGFQALSADGAGSPTTVTSPREMTSLRGANPNTLSGEGCRILSDTTVSCSPSIVGHDPLTFSDVWSDSPSVVAGISNITKLAHDGGAGLMADGRVAIWIRDSNEVMHSGILTDISSAIEIDGGCAVISGGQVRCWEQDSTTAPDGLALTSYPIKNLNNAAALERADSAECAILTTGGVSCWVYDGLAPQSYTATVMAGLSNVTQIVNDDNDQITCAVSQDGLLRCWGFDTSGLTGNPPNTVTTPLVITPFTNVTQVALGFNSACVLTSGQVKCWGNNQFGSLGIGSLSDVIIAPADAVVIPSLANVISISGTSGMGGSFIASLANGQFDFWGDNSFAQDNELSPYIAQGVY